MAETLHVPMQLNGHDGNAFALLATFRKQARREGYSSSQIDRVIKEATSGDYAHLIQTIIAHTK